MDGITSHVTSHLTFIVVAARISNTVASENSTHPKEFKKKDNEERLNNRRGKTIHS